MTVTPQGGPVSARVSHPAQFARTITAHDTNANKARALLINCTAAGNLVIRAMNDTADVTIPIPTGFYELDISVAFVRSTGTTATATIIGLD